MTAKAVTIDATALINVRDEVAVARDIVVCLCLACSSPHLPRDERTALSELGMIVGQKLVAVAGAIDALASPG